MLPRPVKLEKTPVGVIEHRMPEDSERYICYRDGRMPVFYTDEINHSMLRVIRQADGSLYRGGFLGRQARVDEANRQRKQKDFLNKSDEQSREGFDRLKFASKKEDAFGAQFLGKEEKIAEEKKGEARFQKLVEDI